MQDGLTLKIDGLTSLTKQLGKDVQANTAATEGMSESLKLFANAMESQAEAFRELTERITAEPDGEDSLGELLQQIHHTVTLIYARLPAPARK